MQTYENVKEELTPVFPMPDKRKKGPNRKCMKWEEAQPIESILVRFKH